MKLLKLVCALKGGENYPKDLFPEYNGCRTFLDWDCLVFLLPKKEYAEMSYSADYTYKPNILLSLWIMDRRGNHKKLVTIQDLDEFNVEACATDIVMEILRGNMTALNLQRYL